LSRFLAAGGRKEKEISRENDIISLPRAEGGRGKEEGRKRCITVAASWGEEMGRKVTTSLNAKKGSPPNASFRNEWEEEERGEEKGEIEA